MNLADMPLDALLARHACVRDFLQSLGLALPRAEAVKPSPPEVSAEPLGRWLAHLTDEAVLDAGMEREQMLAHIARLIDELGTMAQTRDARVRELTLIGGRDKSGRAEDVLLTLRAGEVVCIVGPTGSGKSRLLADIECLAQADTPTGRQVLVDGAAPDAEVRDALDRKLVAQLSQNMNFVVDLTVRDFITMHARCRMVDAPEEKAAEVIACANDLTGEKFSPDVSVTQLSGGQTRALMIADAALLSASPVVLIDEIENAGVDRKRALDLLVSGEKIVLISTHDPLLALRGQRRVVIRNGGIAEVLTTTEAERANLASIEAIDGVVMQVRERLRQGQRIDAPLAWPTTNDNPALAALLTRRSHHTLRAPGPADDEFALLLAAAQRTPDFGALQPYRFLAARGAGLDRLGQAMQRAAIAAGKSERAIARTLTMPQRAPLVVVVVASPKQHPNVPAFDQQLCAGGAVLMMQMAARALGYSGIWRSGWLMYDRGFHTELGLAEHEQIVGFLYLGTPDEEDAAAPAAPAAGLLRWL